MKKLSLIFSLLLATKMFGAVPTWSVNASAFTYSMNVTTKTNVACNDLTNPSNIIGAFVGAQCRGVAYTNQIVSGNYLAFLTVYSNLASGETVTFKIYDAALDVEYIASTSILFQDGSAFGFPATPFSVLTNYKPTAISISDSTADENVVNLGVGKLTATDPDNSVFTFSLIPGIGDTDNASFTIVGDSLKVNGTLNYEFKNSYSIRLKVSDGACSFERKMSILVNNKYDVPTDINLNNNSINENTSLGTLIGNFNTTDEDLVDNFSYSLVSGAGDTDNSKVSITTAGQLKVGAMYNFEVQDTLKIRVQTMDMGGNTFQKSFLVIIQNVNETPTNIILDTDTFAENLSLATSIIMLDVEDEDLIDSYTYFLDNSVVSNNNLFTLIGNTIKTNSTFNFEVKNTYTIALKVRDAALNEYARQFVLYVEDKNDIPTNLFITDTIVYENATIGTYVGTFTTQDEDANDTYTYTFTSGLGSEGNNYFAIIGDSLVTDSLFNFNTKDFYNIKIRTTDATGAIYDKKFVIKILDVGDAPSDILISDTVIFENMPLGTVIGLFSSVDPDVGDVHFYKLVAGLGDTDNANFKINGTHLTSNKSFDYESKSVFSIRIKTEEGSGLSFEKTFQIYIQNVNESPVIKDTLFYINENVELSSLVGQFIYSDVDSGDVLTTRIFEDDELFKVNNYDLSTNSTIDYENQNKYTLSIIVEDFEGLKDTAKIQILVKDVIEFDKPLGVNKVISPNNDGHNDVLWIENVEVYNNYALTIFNSAGFIVYQINSGYNNSWNASYNEQPVEQGVYYYLFKNNDDASLYFKGSITVLR